MLPEDLLLRKVLFLKVCELLEKAPSLLGKVTKGRVRLLKPKMDEFLEKFQGGEGPFFNPKIHIADFGPLYQAFFEHFLKEIAI